MKPVIFTDLDGTLLNRRDYSHRPAMTALERVGKAGIPLIFASSRTRAEVIHLRARFNNTHPFIVENGGGILIPEGYFPFEVEGEKIPGYTFIKLGKPYEEVRKGFEAAREGVPAAIRGFGDLTDEELSTITGLSVEDCRRAKDREFDEPVFFNGTVETEREFFIRIEENGLKWTRGRYFHVLGAHNKGDGAKILKDCYKRLYGGIVTICLGDGFNDLWLLREADYPVLVMKDDGRFEQIYLDSLIKTDAPGPEGWNKALTRILDSLEASEKGKEG